MGDAHEVIAPRHGQQAGQILDIVLIRLHVIGVAAVTAHADACQLAHEVVLKPGSRHLPGVIQILRPDETHNGVDQKWLEPLGKTIAPCLHGHLIRTMMGIAGQFGPLPRLEIHHVRPLRRALGEQELPCLLDGGGVEAESRIARLAARNRLENQVTGRPLTHGLHLGRHMGQNADLGGNSPVLLDLLKPPQDFAHLLRGVRHRVQADDRIPRAEAQTLQRGSRDALRVVGGVVGLEAAGKGPRQADGGIAVGRDPDFTGGINQVEVAHQLRHRRHHFRRQPPADAPDVRPCGVLVQQPLPEFRHIPIPNLGKNLLVDVILNDPGNLVLFVGHRRVLPQVPQRQVRQYHLGRHPLPGILRRQPRQLIPGFFLIRLGQNILNVPESVCFSQ